MSVAVESDRVALPEVGDLPADPAAQQALADRANAWWASMPLAAQLAVVTLVGNPTVQHWVHRR